MNNSDWLQRWKNAETGFHQPVVNEYLIKYWDRLAGSTVFIPLCGKTLDILWLANKGLQVIGIEISDIAIKEFFAENTLSYHKTTTRGFDIYESGNIKLICGDFFDLRPADFPAETNVFDRASLIALPPDVRKKYAQHLIEIMPNNTSVLLVCMNYAQNEMNGPPFSVSDEELQQLYRDSFQLTLLQSEEILENEPRFKARGLSKLEEKVYLLEPKFR